MANTVFPTPQDVTRVGTGLVQATWKSCPAATSTKVNGSLTLVIGKYYWLTADQDIWWQQGATGGAVATSLATTVSGKPLWARTRCKVWIADGTADGFIFACGQTTTAIVYLEVVE